MASEFDRNKYQISGRAVTVTSWFDVTAGSWSAGAPNYHHLLYKNNVSGLPTRKAAEEKVVLILRSLIPPRERPTYD